MEHAHCTLDTQGYTHTLSICNGIALPVQQWLYGRSSVMRYTYIGCLDISFHESYLFELFIDPGGCRVHSHVVQTCECCFFLLACLTLVIRFHSCDNALFSVIFVQICVILGRTKEGNVGKGGRMERKNETKK